MSALHRTALADRRNRLRILLWAMLLLAGHALQVVAAAHWHGETQRVADSSAGSQPSDLAGHDGCLLCQVAAHAGDTAPPPAPWVLHVAPETSAAMQRDSAFIAAALRPSHAWQGRAPPRV